MIKIQNLLLKTVILALTFCLDTKSKQKSQEIPKAINPANPTHARRNFMPTHFLVLKLLINSKLNIELRFLNIL
jgi:hypothetical protein